MGIRFRDSTPIELFRDRVYIRGKWTMGITGQRKKWTMEGMDNGRQMASIQKASLG